MALGSWGIHSFSRTASHVGVGGRMGFFADGAALDKDRKHATPGEKEEGREGGARGGRGFSVSMTEVPS